MPETQPQDFTRRDILQIADICKEATDLLRPASAELTRFVEDIKADRPEDAVFYTRTNRHLLGTVFHLQGCVFDLFKAAENVGRTYSSVKSKFLGLNLAGWTVAVVLALLKLVLPAHAGNIASQLAPTGVGFAIGVTVSLVVLEYYVTGKQRRFK